MDDTFLQISSKFFKIVVLNPPQFPILKIPVPLSFTVCSWMFLYLSELLFRGYIRLERHFERRKLCFVYRNITHLGGHAIFGRHAMLGRSVA